jgi:GDPmannose 4,6-dehydratase
LAAQSHVVVSFEIPEFTADVVAVGALRILEALRMTGLNARSYQASSSEMSGLAPPPKNERTPFHTRSPYGVSKVFPW